MIVYAAGVFDILHGNHVRYLEAAKALGDVLVVGLVDDEGVERYKSRRPAMSLQERWDVVKALRCVDYVVRQKDTDPTDTLQHLKNQHDWTIGIMVRSDDFIGRPPGSDFIERYGGKVVRLPYGIGVNSTLIKERIRCGF